MGEMDLFPIVDDLYCVIDGLFYLLVFNVLSIQNSRKKNIVVELKICRT